MPALVAAFKPPASSNLNQDNADARSFTYAPAGRRPIRDYAGLGRVRVGHGIQSGEVEGYHLSNSEYFLAGGRGTWTQVIRRRRSTLQTVVKHPSSSHTDSRSSNHDHFRPYRKLKHPTKTSRHSITTTATTTGVLHQDLSYTLSVVWTQDHADFVRVWTGVRVEGKGKSQMRPRDLRVGLGWTRSWMGDSCWYCTEVCCRFLFGTWCLVLHSQVYFLKDAIFSRCVLACLSSASSIRCRRRFPFTLLLARDADEYLCIII